MSNNQPQNNLLEEKIQEILAPYPDTMTRTDLRISCHIGTRTAIYLLQSGLIPNIHSGKKTRCYKIAKADVAEYLRRRETDPEYYTPPSGWYGKNFKRKPPKVSIMRSINYEIISRLLTRQYFENLLKPYPDVLSVKQISEITGYKHKVVTRWCATERLKSILKSPRYMVPKTWLLDFLVSDDYNNICRKSGKHYAMIREISR